jgi:hypothetical protein
MVFAAGIEENKTIVGVIMSDARQPAYALEIDLVERRSGGARAARVARHVAASDDFHIQTLEVELCRMIDVVPIAAAGTKQGAATRRFCPPQKPRFSW